VGWKELAVSLVAQFEGCARRGADGLIYTYLDKLAKPPVFTRGYGRTYGITGESPPITFEEARRELGVGLEAYARRCTALSPVLASRPAALAAVTSWAWNCGVGAYQHSRLRKAVNRGDWVSAVELIKRPRTAGGVEYRGLARRRDAESALLAKEL
jgi:GH24 family phage-related lysozyme (muramidase)